MSVCVCVYMSIELSGDNILQLIKEVNKAVQNEKYQWYKDKVVLIRTSMYIVIPWAKKFEQPQYTLIP